MYDFNNSKLIIKNDNNNNIYKRLACAGFTLH